MRGRAVGGVPDTLHELAIGDAGGAEEDVVAGDQIGGGQHPVEVMARIEGLAALGLVARPQPGLDHAAQAADRARRDDALRGAADPGEQVDTRAIARGHDGAGDVAVGDELDAGPGRAHIVDELLVTGAVQDADRQVSDVLALCARDRCEVHADGRGDVDDIGALGADDQFLHVEHGTRVVHGPPLRDRENGNGIRHALGGEGGAIDGVDGDIRLGAGAVTHVLAVEQHGRVVLLALADHDDAVHRDGADQQAHGVDGGAVGTVLVATPDPACGGHGRGLGDTDEFKGQVAVRYLGGQRVNAHVGSVAMAGGRLPVRWIMIGQ